MTAALRRRHLVRHLHRLGERAIDELLIELGQAHGIEADIIARLERYATIDINELRAVGADRLWLGPLYVVARDGR